MLRCFVIIFLGFISMLHAKSDAKPDMKPRKVCVFCSADDKISGNLKEMAYALGEKLAENGFHLVTGGSKTGLMNEVTHGFLAQGDKKNVEGVLPSALRAFNVSHPGIPTQNIFWTDSMHERLTTFHEECSSVVVLAGGFGTLHELMDFLVHAQFKLIEPKKLILLNYDGFWDGLKTQFQTMQSSNALSEKHLELLNIVDSIDDCLETLQASTQAKGEGLDGRYWEAKTP